MTSQFYRCAKSAKVFLLCSFASISFHSVAAENPCSTTQTSAAQRFRNIFFANGQSQYSQEQLSSLLFIPTQELDNSDLQEPFTNDPLQKFDSVATHWMPSGAYNLGKTTLPCTESSQVQRDPEENPPLFVLIPELLAEIVAHAPLAEVTNNPNSPFTQEWQNQILKPSNARLTWDKSFNLSSLSTRPVPMSDLVTTGSIEDEHGHTLANVMALRARMGSMESIGTPQESATMFLPRLEKFLRIMGTPQKIYLMGYSRGATIALEMLARATAHPDLFPWVSNMRGIISLGGVNFGSVVADNILTKGTPLNRIDASLVDLANSLEVDENGDSTADLAQKVARNTARWVTKGAGFVAAVASFPVAQGFAKENPSLAIPARDALVDYTKDLFINTFHLDKPVSDYFGNVRRFKHFVANVQKAIVALSTPERLQWWRTHTLPQGVHLMSVAATMGDPWQPETGVWPLTKNPVAYDPGVFDFSLLRLSYYENVRNVGFRVHDGMVSAERAMFWPNLIENLNPQNINIPTHNLALFGVDHFGLMLESAAPRATGRKNPFPRALLMRISC